MEVINTSKLKIEIPFFKGLDALLRLITVFFVTTMVFLFFVTTVMFLLLLEDLLTGIECE